MEAPLLKAKPLGTIVSLRSKPIMIVCLGLIVLFGIGQITRSKTKLLNDELKEDKAILSGVVAKLPDTYKEIPSEKASLNIKPSKRELSEIEKLLIQKALEKEKRAEAARASKVSFEGFNNEPSNGDRSFINNENPENKKEPINQRDEANRQDDKLNFLNSKNSNGETTLDEKIKPLASPFTILAGSVIPGLMITGLNSDLPGDIVGQVSRNVYDSVTGNYLLIPQGTKILGSYDSRIVFGQSRVLVVWNRLLYPNGSSVVLQNMKGVDMGGYAGMSDLVNNHYGKLITGVVLTSMLGATAQISEGQRFQTNDPSYSQLATQGFARELNSVGSELTRRNLAVQPTLEIRAGTRFQILVNKDMTLKPYKGGK